MADNVKAAALAANLQGESKKQVDDMVKALFVHKELSNLPKDVFLFGEYVCVVNILLN